jgi:hypothetical protein
MGEIETMYLMEKNMSNRNILAVKTLISHVGLWENRPLDPAIIPIGFHYFVLKDTPFGGRDYIFNGVEYV